MSVSTAFTGVTTPEISARMRAVRRKDTGPEIRLRRELHNRGLRYRVEARLEPLPRHRADIMFTRARIVIFVDGCFWHGCPSHGSTPRANVDWWTGKLARVRERDARVNAVLADAGWHVLRFWEHEDPKRAADVVERAVRNGQPRPEVNDGSFLRST